MGNCASSPKEGNGHRQAGKSSKSHQLQEYNPVHYESEAEIIRNPKRIVSRVHFVAQTILQNGGNHWIIYLQTGPAQAVRINMDPSDILGAKIPGHGYRGKLNILHRSHDVTNNRHCLITIPATRGHPVSHFIDAIINAGNHEYDFTTEGRGCTGWILDQFHLFLQLGLIPSGFDVLETAINQEWYQERPRAARPATRGFYMRETRGGGWSRREVEKRRGARR